MMKKRFLSLLLCLCMICSLTTTVFGAGNFWVNSLDSEMQRTIMRTNGNELTIEVLTYDGEDIIPMALISNSTGTVNTPVLLEKGDYSWVGKVTITEDSSVCVYDTSILGNINWMIKSVKVLVGESGIYIHKGNMEIDNTRIREKMYTSTETDVIPVNPVVQRTTDEICSGLKSDIDKARAIYLWMCENIAYDYDAYNNSLMGQKAYPSEVLLHKNAVCFGLSNLYKAMLNSQGIPCKVIGGRQAGGASSSGYGHAWNEFYTTGGQGVGAGWYLVDCTGGARLGYENGSFFPNFDADDKFYSYTKANYFMPDDSFVNTYFMYEYELPPQLNILDAAKVSEWAVEDISYSRENSLLVDGLFLDDYVVPVTRDYFADLIVQYIKGEYVNNKLSAMDKNTIEYANMRNNARNEIDKKLVAIAKENPAYTGGRLANTPSSGTKMGMAFCNQVGIIAGKGDAGLCPDDTLTRAEAATMLYRLYDYMKKEGYTSDKFDLKSFAKINSADYFRDHMDIPEWALDGCYGCKDKGVIKGDDNNRFLPNNELTAEQCVAILSRMLQTK